MEELVSRAIRRKTVYLEEDNEGTSLSSRTMELAMALPLLEVCSHTELFGILHKPDAQVLGKLKCPGTPHATEDMLALLEVTANEQQEACQEIVDNEWTTVANNRSSMFREIRCHDGKAYYICTSLILFKNNIMTYFHNGIPQGRPIKTVCNNNEMSM